MELLVRDITTAISAKSNFHAPLGRHGGGDGKFMVLKFITKFTVPTAAGAKSVKTGSLLCYDLKFKIGLKDFGKTGKYK